MSFKAADLLVEALIDWRIDIVLRLPGDGVTVARALAEPGPALIAAVIDGNESVLPPTRLEDHVDHLKQGLASGASCRAEIERALIQDPALTS